MIPSPGGTTQFPPRFFRNETSPPVPASSWKNAKPTVPLLLAGGIREHLRFLISQLTLSPAPRPTDTLVPLGPSSKVVGDSVHSSRPHQRVHVIVPDRPPGWQEASFRNRPMYLKWNLTLACKQVICKK